eukprot:TRINITY_DN1817_c0_g1_i1.p1 TRINITY_DN1817_c0_g1~~TRINITY_DN1817_c0_g1_i1.p1  ORF type:complete len:664 (-),score=134.64 TRINITY_DN1817_c0_g1_i1:48-2039(-)
MEIITREDDYCWRVERDLAVVRLMIDKFCVFVSRALNDESEKRSPSTTEAFRLFDKDESGENCSRCIFNNFASFLGRTSFYMVAFFGRRAPEKQKRDGPTALDSVSLDGTTSPSESDSILEKIIKADDDLTRLMATKPELHERILCYFSTRIGVVDAKADLPLRDDDEEEEASTNERSERYSPNPTMDDINYANLVFMTDPSVGDLWRTYSMHTVASTDLSSFYYSSVRIHNLHVHLALPFPLLLQVANANKSNEPIVQVFYPEAEPDAPEATRAALKGANRNKNVHLKRAQTTRYESFFYLVDIQTKFFNYRTPGELTESGVVVYHQPSRLYRDTSLRATSPTTLPPFSKYLSTAYLETYSRVPVHPSLESTRPLYWTSFLGSNAFGFYSQVAKHVSETLRHPVVMIECYAVVEECPSITQVPLNIIEALHIDFSFLCGGRYVVWRSKDASSAFKSTPLQLVVAPVRSLERYKSAPVYFADFIVRQNSSLNSLQDIAAKFRDDTEFRFAFNEVDSLSGYQLPLSHLKENGVDISSDSFKVKCIKTGSHSKSIQSVINGQADIAAIDSVVLEMEKKRNPQLETLLKTIESTPPFTIPPIVAANWVNEDVRGKVAKVLTDLALDTPCALANAMKASEFCKFVNIESADYEPVRKVVDSFSAQTL